MKRILLLLSVALVGLATLPAQVLLNEIFSSYDDGPLTDVSGQAWVAYSGTTPLFNLAGVGAYIDQADITAGRQDVNHLLSSSFDPATDNTSRIYGSFTVYYSFSLPVTGDSDGSYFAHLRSSSANEYALIGANTNGAAPGMFRLAVANESWNVANTVEYGLDLRPSTFYQVVFRLDLATDQTTLWVNPTDESSLSVTATDAISYTGSINAYALRQGTSGTGAPGALLLDNLMVGQSFADVTTAVPEPTTYALVGTALAAFCFMRRFRRK